MSPRHSPSAAKFVDCAEHAPQADAELLLVEGDSALSSVVALRNGRTQAVLALQGKPLNPLTGGAARVDRHAQYRLLAQALGLASPTAAASQPVLDGLRFQRLLLLFDPDVDGIHIGALLVLYVQRWLPALLAAGRLWQVHAPMFELLGADGELLHADHPAQCRALAERLRAQCGGVAPQVRGFRGLGSLPPELLRRRCVDPTTRIAHAVGAAEVGAVMATFGAGAN